MTNRPRAEDYVAKVGPESLGFYKSYADAARAYGDAVLEAAAEHLHKTDYEAAAGELRAWMREKSDPGWTENL